MRVTIKKVNKNRQIPFDINETWRPYCRRSDIEKNMRNCVTWKKRYSQSVYVTGRNRIRYNLPSTKDIEDETTHLWKSNGLDIDCEWQI